LLGAAIGMALLYFMVASVCSFMLEALHALTNLRGKALGIFLYQMLNGVKQSAGDQAINLMNHPLLEQLKKPDFGLHQKHRSFIAQPSCRSRCQS
jgi:hypothetical protein